MSSATTCGGEVQKSQGTSSQLKTVALQQPMHQVFDAVVLGGAAAVAEQLSADHFGPEVRQLDSH